MPYQSAVLGTPRVNDAQQTAKTGQNHTAREITLGETEFGARGLQQGEAGTTASKEKLAPSIHYATLPAVATIMKRWCFLVTATCSNSVAVGYDPKFGPNCFQVWTKEQH